MKRITALMAAAAMIATPALARQPVSSEAPPEDTAPPAAASLVQPAAPAVVETPPAAPVSAPAATIDPSIYQVLRTGDRQMSCESLASEANTLNAELMAEQQEAAKKSRKAKAGKGVMGGAAGGLMAGAARYGLARGMMGGAFSPLVAQVAVAATDSTAAAAGAAIANSGDDGQPATVSPKQQRMSHLLSLYREKQC
ncbi:MAG: hypothetical protein Q7J28_07515 [Caulobacter sp.]|nr:hypothetical protein [Caulobacter sp.]